jgi:hypothetical protein
MKVTKERRKTASLLKVTGRLGEICQSHLSLPEYDRKITTSSKKVVLSIA